MAKHRRLKKQSANANRAKHLKRRRTPALMLAGTTAMGMSAALVFGHATDTTADSSQIELAAAAIGVGGRGDATAARIPAKINGTVVPDGYTYVPVNYPASFFIDRSVEQGVPALHQAVVDNAGQDKIVVIGYSEGALVAEEERRALADSGIDPDKLSFIMIASPNVPNGGIYGRFPRLNLLFLSSNGPAEPSAYDTTYYTNEYDPYADFPAYFNPVSLANTLVAVQYVHPDQYYDTVDLTPVEDGGPAYKKVVTNSAGGTDTYYFIKAEHLPLYQPLRDVSNAVGLAIITDPVLDGTEPVVRLIVDMGYTDRENLNPEAPTRFRLITPPARVIQTVSQVPGALTEGANNVARDLAPTTSSSTPSTATTGPSSPSLRQLPAESKDPVQQGNSEQSKPDQKKRKPESAFSITDLAANNRKTLPDNAQQRRPGAGRLADAVHTAVDGVFGRTPKRDSQSSTSAQGQSSDSEKPAA